MGLQPQYVRLAGLPGEVAFMALNEADMQAYKAKHPVRKQVGHSIHLRSLGAKREQTGVLNVKSADFVQTF